MWSGFVWLRIGPSDMFFGVHELLGFIKYTGFEKTNDYKLLKETFAPWTWYENGIILVTFYHGK